MLRTPGNIVHQLDNAGTNDIVKKIEDLVDRETCRSFVTAKFTLCDNGTWGTSNIQQSIKSLSSAGNTQDICDENVFKTDNPFEELERLESALESELNIGSQYYLRSLEQIREEDKYFSDAQTTNFASNQPQASQFESEQKTAHHISPTYHKHTPLGTPSKPSTRPISPRLRTSIKKDLSASITRSRCGACNDSPTISEKRELLKKSKLKRKPDLNRINSLYNLSFSSQQEREFKKIRFESQKQLRELKECTFKPRLFSSKRMRNRVSSQENISMFNRNVSWGQKIADKCKLKRESLDREKLVECTFKPRTNHLHSPNKIHVESSHKRHDKMYYKQSEWRSRIEYKNEELADSIYTVACPINKKKKEFKARKFRDPRNNIWHRSSIAKSNKKKKVEQGTEVINISLNKFWKEELKTKKNKNKLKKVVSTRDGPMKAELEEARKMLKNRRKSNFVEF